MRRPARAVADGGDTECRTWPPRAAAPRQQNNRAGAMAVARREEES